ncbi:Riboflavin biosynthesis protein RibF [bacterium HR19]|nr:Riboflavin biosynthesis protein RibF [bacterium HR19]
MLGRVRTIFWWEISEKVDIKNPVLCIGNFDGVHIGHRKVVSTARDLAQKIKKPLCIMSFLPHPRFIFRPENFFILSPISEKIKVFEELGADYFLIVNFLKVKDFEPEEFCELVKEKLSPSGIVVGKDFSFGKDAKGRAEDIEKIFSNEAEVIIVELVREKESDQKEEEHKVSSSLIRKLIIDGKVKEVKKFLGEFYSVKGCVVKGAMRGKSLGFPTANIATTFFLPRDGVYACFVRIDSKTFKGVCNVGNQPTFGSNRRTLEVFIFDFNQNIYLKQIEVFFVERIRDVMKFSSPSELKERISKDVDLALAILKGEVS